MNYKIHFGLDDVIAVLKFGLWLYPLGEVNQDEIAILILEAVRIL